MSARTRFRPLSLVLITAMSPLACKDPTTIGYDLKLHGPGPIEAYGLVLDEQSPPQDVVFVLLQAVRDDIKAARAHDRKAQLEAINLQAALAATEWMHTGYQQALDRKTMPVHVTPEQSVFKLIRFWGPLLAHYVGSIQTAYQPAVDQMTVAYNGDQPQAVVTCDLSAKDASNATLQVDLLRENGFWRIKRLGFVPPSVARTNDTAMDERTGLD